MFSLSGVQACASCGGTDVFLRRKGTTQIGLYCLACGRWHKWVGKKEVQDYRRRGYPIYEEDFVPRHLDIPPASNAPMPSASLASPVSAPSTGHGGGRTSAGGLIGRPLNPHEDFKDLGIPLNVDSHSVPTASKPSPFAGHGRDQSSNPCPVCASGVLDSLSSSDDCKATIFAGVLTVTSRDNTRLFGSYKINYCPACGSKIS